MGMKPEELNRWNEKTNGEIQHGQLRKDDTRDPHGLVIHGHLSLNRWIRLFPKSAT